VKVYGPVPPDMLAIAVPSQAPLQVTSVLTIVSVVAGGSMIVIVLVVKQPRASVTVYVYAPAHKLVAVTVVETAGADHEYEYAGVPPEVFKFTEPVQEALHNMLDCVGATDNVGGDVIATVIVLIQLTLLVTVQV